MMCKNILFVSVILVFIVLLASADTDEPGTCFDEYGKQRSEGDTWGSIGDGILCVEFECHYWGNVGANGCPDIHVPDGYELTQEDVYKPYPICCPQLVKKNIKRNGKKFKKILKY